MWGTGWKLVASRGAKAVPVVAVSAYTSINSTYNNNNNSNNINTRCDKDAKAAAKFLRKKTTLRLAAPGKTAHPRRFNTRQELSKIREMEEEMLQRWQKDEDGWRELPARAWPAYQPNPEQLKGIQAQIAKYGCNATIQTDLCTELLFNAATALVFYNVDAKAGLRQYEELANHGHVESMVACGVVMLEGMGVPPQEAKGIEWLKKAVALGSAQGCYELGTALYTGIDGVLDEDPEGAFALFEKAAEKDHTAALYMMADCLVEGEGTKKDIARAVPLLYKAADRGHRYSRQRIRELLSRKEYMIPL